MLRSCPCWLPRLCAYPSLVLARVIHPRSSQSGRGAPGGADPPTVTRDGAVPTPCPTGCPGPTGSPSSPAPASPPTAASRTTAARTAWTRDPDAEKLVTLGYYLADPEIRRRSWLLRAAMHDADPTAQRRARRAGRAGAPGAAARAGHPEHRRPPPSCASAAETGRRCARRLDRGARRACERWRAGGPSTIYFGQMLDEEVVGVHRGRRRLRRLPRRRHLAPGVAGGRAGRHRRRQRCAPRRRQRRADAVRRARGSRRPRTDRLRTATAGPRRLA